MKYLYHFHEGKVRPWLSFEGWIFPSEENNSINKLTFIHLDCFKRKGVNGCVDNKDDRFFGKMNCWACNKPLPEILKLEFIARI